MMRLWVHVALQELGGIARRRTGISLVLRPVLLACMAFGFNSHTKRQPQAQHNLHLKTSTHALLMCARFSPYSY